MAKYGQGDATFQVAGGEVGIRALVDHFYDIMAEEWPEILALHPEDNALSRDKLTLFLCGWTGGPRLFQEKYGLISIPGVHAHLPITPRLRDGWLECMEKAAVRMGYAEDFREYLLEQLGVPARMVTRAEG